MQIYAPTFVTHDCDLYTSFCQHSEAFSFTAVLHVAEVKAGDENPQAKVGHFTKELAQFDGAVGAWGPGAEPGDGVTEPSFSSSSISKQTRAQGSQVT